VLTKIRDGKLRAAVAEIGAVLNPPGGKADAARAKELSLERAQVT
jgi:aspartyl-tRNA(Asn)/glutamyl-tRNA(Gln) amidotransferase subunit B